MPSLFRVVRLFKVYQDAAAALGTESMRLVLATKVVVLHLRIAVVFELDILALGIDEQVA